MSNTQASKLIEKLKATVDYIKGEDGDMDGISWGYQDGVLISGNDAELIISLLSTPPQEGDPDDIAESLRNSFYKETGLKVETHLVGYIRWLEKKIAEYRRYREPEAKAIAESAWDACEASRLECYCGNCFNCEMTKDEDKAPNKEQYLSQFKK